MRSEILIRCRACRDCLLGIVHPREWRCTTRQVVASDTMATPREIARWSKP